MNALLWLPRGLWKIYYLLFFCISLIVMYPLFYITLQKEGWFKYAFQLMRYWALFLQVFGGIILQVKHRDRLPKNEPFIICPNHGSYLDIILMYRVFPDYFVFMGKGELKNWPLFNIFFTKGMNILVERDSSHGAYQAYTRASEDLAKGHSIIIFPEAGIPGSAPKMRRFKNGAFKLAIEKSIPIVPVTFTANWKLLQGTVLLKGKAGPGITKAIIHEPIRVDHLTESDMVSLKKQVYETIDKPLRDLFGA